MSPSSAARRAVIAALLVTTGLHHTQWVLVAAGIALGGYTLAHAIPRRTP